MSWVWLNIVHPQNRHEWPNNNSDNNNKDDNDTDKTHRKNKQW